MTPLNAYPETHTDWMTMSETAKSTPRSRVAKVGRLICAGEQDFGGALAEVYAGKHGRVLYDEARRQFFEDCAASDEGIPS